MKGWEPRSFCDENAGRWKEVMSPPKPKSLSRPRLVTSSPTRLKEDNQNATFSSVTNQDAFVLRENTGTSGVMQTARTAAEVLADHDIPHLIVGGIAVQEYGYPRVTIDVDIVVPDVLEAMEFLTADLSGLLCEWPVVRTGSKTVGTA